MVKVLLKTFIHVFIFGSSSMRVAIGWACFLGTHELI